MNDWHHWKPAESMAYTAPHSGKSAKILAVYAMNKFRALARQLDAPVCHQRVLVPR